MEATVQSLATMFGGAKSDRSDHFGQYLDCHFPFSGLDEFVPDEAQGIA